jgi:hypothetical protein
VITKNIIDFENEEDLVFKPKKVKKIKKVKKEEEAQSLQTDTFSTEMKKKKKKKPTIIEQVSVNFNIKNIRDR